MGNSESANPIRNMDKRTARREYGESFSNAISQFRVNARASQNNQVGMTNETWNDGNIRVYVRKRPIFKHETDAFEFDVATCINDKSIVIHDCRMHADMKRQLVSHNEFEFDTVFDEKANNEKVYANSAKSLVDITLSGGYSTALVYGQTGSGKTFTMTSIYEKAARDIFTQLDKVTERFPTTPPVVTMSFVEIAGDRVSDLLNGFEASPLLSCSDGSVHAYPVVEPVVSDAEALMAMIQHGMSIRSTAATGVHDASSRSHAILRIYIQRVAKGGELVEGTLTLVDLAGSEHRIDSMYHGKERRKETGNINASLMALKECIRARAAGKNLSHQYRKSKLTMALKSSFSLPTARTIVIACVSPASKDTEHSLNTLRHACIMHGQQDKGSGKIQSEYSQSAGNVDEETRFVTGGKVTTQLIGEVNLTAMARKNIQLKKAGSAMAGPKTSNGNAVDDSKKAKEANKEVELTDKEKERNKRAAERRAFSKLTPEYKELLTYHRTQLGNEVRQLTRMRRMQPNYAQYGDGSVYPVLGGASGGAVAMGVEEEVEAPDNNDNDNNSNNEEEYYDEHEFDEVDEYVGQYSQQAYRSPTKNNSTKNSRNSSPPPPPPKQTPPSGNMNNNRNSGNSNRSSAIVKERISFESLYDSIFSVGENIPQEILRRQLVALLKIHGYTEQETADLISQRVKTDQKQQQQQQYRVVSQKAISTDNNKADISPRGSGRSVPINNNSNSNSPTKYSPRDLSWQPNSARGDNSNNNNININNNSKQNIALHTQPSNKGNKSSAQVSEEDINLNDWRAKGYPSEYAYAKDLGFLDRSPQHRKSSAATLHSLPVDHRFAAEDTNISNNNNRPRSNQSASRPQYSTNDGDDDFSEARLDTTPPPKVQSARNQRDHNTAPSAGHSTRPVASKPATNTSISPKGRSPSTGRPVPKKHYSSRFDDDEGEVGEDDNSYLQAEKQREQERAAEEKERKRVANLEATRRVQVEEERAKRDQRREAAKSLLVQKTMPKVYKDRFDDNGDDMQDISSKQSGRTVAETAKQQEQRLADEKERKRLAGIEAARQKLEDETRKRDQRREAAKALLAQKNAAMRSKPATSGKSDPFGEDTEVGIAPGNAAKSGGVKDGPKEFTGNRNSLAFHEFEIDRLTSQLESGAISSSVKFVLRKDIGIHKKALLEMNKNQQTQPNHQSQPSQQQYERNRPTADSAGTNSEDITPQPDALLFKVRPADKNRYATPTAQPNSQPATRQPVPLMDINVSGSASAGGAGDYVYGPRSARDYQADDSSFGPNVGGRGGNVPSSRYPEPEIERAYKQNYDTYGSSGIGVGVRPMSGNRNTNNNINNSNINSGFSGYSNPQAQSDQYKQQLYQQSAAALQNFKTEFPSYERQSGGENRTLAAYARPGMQQQYSQQQAPMATEYRQQQEQIDKYTSSYSRQQAPPAAAAQQQVQQISPPRVNYGRGRRVVGASAAPFANDYSWDTKGEDI